jgi:hypothetical protein
MSRHRRGIIATFSGRALHDERTRAARRLATTVDRYGGARVRAGFESPWFQRRGRQVLLFAAIVGIILGIVLTARHVASDPLADIHVYYDAGARLNAGQPLYIPGPADNPGQFYKYPPLLAIIFRPLALLPFEAAAAIWMAAMIAAFALTLRRLGNSFSVRIALAILAFPIGWSIVIGQTQVLVTWLVTLGTPAGVALAANLKVFPALIGFYWLGRRDMAAVARLAIFGSLLVLLQFVLEPAATRYYFSFLSLDQVGEEINNLSPYALSQALWLVLLIAGNVAVVLLAPSRWGWPAAVVFSTLAAPRLFVYHLMTLLAALRSPDAESRTTPMTVPATQAVQTRTELQ